ncbi:putative transcription factor C2H2 family [Helianthus annuus]|uniref:Putative ubiquitin-protein ligase n=1 Tax=Helianthus annuus TaxID=4232 RepID=A0A251VB28_HELAN|nr:E3 ubiquitin-protein ligase HOS1 [Helianthus annuus]KAF5816276.1 putative transcription factor C2H2 family [Helianthus annuus]KAJ0945543.1 putative transcription factor C2H2 family [Helianthus annuus]
MEEMMLLDDGATTIPLDSGNRNAIASPSTSHISLQPNYSCRKVQEALEHLATIDLIDLCNEAKVEHCRATRDLRSCGCSVQSVLNSCGHASLCEECSQRSDVCPICRVCIPKTGNRLSLRLYYECIEAGLISKRYDDRVQEKDGENRPTDDVERLYLFFDVALENNLLSLICHYITDVCMDESAVSSDPVVALLLDEVVVKDWCKRTFKNIIAELKPIYNLNVEEMKERSNVLLKFTARLACILTVLEVLESSFKGSLSAQLQDIHHLQESILKTKQHMEMMIWYTRHQHLEDLNRHASFPSWRSDVRERKSTAIKRAWPAPTEISTPDGEILFIHDALSNLDPQQEYTPDRDYELEIASLHKDEGFSLSRAKIEGLVGSYPFKNLRSAIDVLFLYGSSDLVVAKQAIFLYYLFDRLWKIHDDKWRFSVDDFSATFNIARHSILESFTFYLLDDHSDEALQEACRLLPEISGPTTHPKVAQVLLERQDPYTALMVLRWSGIDSGPELVSLNEAVTAVRVRVECGLLIEAFMYQRSVCTKIKQKKARHELSEDRLNWLEILATEICLLCIRRNLVDRIIGLPWNVDEEKHLHKCLVDYVSVEPLTNTGSLLVVFYLQRHRYVEAYQVDQKLQSLEENIISNNLVDDDGINRMRTTQRWRAALVNKSIQLLPEVEQEKVKNGQMTDITPPEINFNDPENPNPNLLDSGNLVPAYVNSSIILQLDDANPSPKLNFGGLTNYGTPVSQVNKFGDTERGMSMLKSISKNFKFDDIIATSTTPLKEFNRGSSTIKKNKYLQNDQNESTDRIRYSSPYFGNITASFEDSPSGIDDLLKSKASGKGGRSSRLGRDADVAASADLMDMTWSNKDEMLPVQANVNGGPRWRSDDASDYEVQQSPDRLTGGASLKSPSRGLRRSRRTRR